MIWTNDDIKLVEKFIDIRNRGLYCDGRQLTEAYNRILEKNVHVTSCGSCLRQRVTELEKALNQFKAKIALEEEKNNAKVENKKETNDATVKGTPEKKSSGKKGRKKRTE